MKHFIETENHKIYEIDSHYCECVHCTRNKINKNILASALFKDKNKFLNTLKILKSDHPKSYFNLNDKRIVFTTNTINIWIEE